MRRDIKKSFWVNSEEDRDIKAKSQAAGLTEAEFLRQRVKGYHPVIMPDEVFWKTMKTPPQYSHLCSRTFSCDVGLGCCRAYLLLHLSEQKIRRRPCPLRAGMALPQFGHRPITLMLPISASSTISHLEMFSHPGLF